MNLVFIPLCRFHTHNLYILRHCSNSVYISQVGVRDRSLFAMQKSLLTLQCLANHTHTPCYQTRTDIHCACFVSMEQDRNKYVNMLGFFVNCLWLLLQIHNANILCINVTTPVFILVLLIGVVMHFLTNQYVIWPLTLVHKHSS